MRLLSAGTDRAYATLQYITANFNSLEAKLAARKMGYTFGEIVWRKNFIKECVTLFSFFLIQFT